MAAIEKLPQSFGPIGENPLDVAPHKEPVKEGAAAGRIAHMVGRQRPAVMRGEMMDVDPEAIRSPNLFVLKVPWWIPRRDARSPAHLPLRANR